mmetsp:Transcript_3472/g.7524  ORF Transcript_3472/g.7524 Transcript_3472/m.7524 type:complete len:130 (-) Transcript_3472:430-819(-)
MLNECVLVHTGAEMRVKHGGLHRNAGFQNGRNRDRCLTLAHIDKRDVNRVLFREILGAEQSVRQRDGRVLVQEPQNFHLGDLRRVEQRPPLNVSIITRNGNDHVRNWGAVFSFDCFHELGQHHSNESFV